jgi:nucleoside-diphosphate-sugar epimerase
MKGKKMFILGGTGFVGAETIHEAIEQGWEVRALSRSDANAERLRALGATPVVGTAEAPEGWIAEAKGCDVLIDLVQPKLGERISISDIEALSRERQAITRALVAALAALSPDERPLLVGVSGTDDLAPDGEGRIDVSPALRDKPMGFARIGIPVRRIIEASRLSATFLYLGTVYGPGKSFAATVFPRIARSRMALPGRAANRFPLIHVRDVARAIVHLASLESERLEGRSWLLVDETGGAPLGDFFDEAARCLGAALPRRLPVWLMSLVIGRTAVETLTRDVAASPKALLETGFRFTYPTPREGLPPTLRALGYEPPPPAPTRGGKRDVLAPLVLALVAMVSINTLRFPLSVPWMRELAGGRTILDARLGYGPSEVLELLSSLGEAGRARYLTMLWTFDLVLPALFTLVLFRAMRAGSFRRWRWLTLAPGVADYLENIAVSALLVAGPVPSVGLVAVASGLTLTKYGLYSSAALLATAGFFKRP